MVHASIRLTTLTPLAPSTPPGWFRRARTLLVGTRPPAHAVQSAWRESVQMHDVI
jgi:hypothetical protein